MSKAKILIGIIIISLIAFANVSQARRSRYMPSFPFGSDDFIMYSKTFFPTLNLVIKNLDVTGVLNANETHFTNTTVIDVNVTRNLTVEDTVTAKHFNGSWNGSPTGNLSDTFVPYVGANQNVNLGDWNLTTKWVLTPDRKVLTTIDGNTTIYSGSKIEWYLNDIIGMRLSELSPVKLTAFQSLEIYGTLKLFGNYYQEIADSYFCEGNWLEGCSTPYDANWDTWDRARDLGTTTYLYINYTKPLTAVITSSWMVKTTAALLTISNLTIDTNCWNQNPLQFRVESYSALASSVVNWTCWNGTRWYSLSLALAIPSVYEEAMWWDFDESSYGLESLKSIKVGIDSINLYESGWINASENITTLKYCIDSDCIINWSEVNTTQNNSEHWNASLITADIIKEAGVRISDYFSNDTFLNIDGSNANQDIDFGAYDLEVTWFNGSFNWTPGDPWTSFDGDTLTYNESLLNHTISQNATGTINPLLISANDSVKYYSDINDTMINDSMKSYSVWVNSTMNDYVDALNVTMTALAYWLTASVMDNGTINQTIAMIIDNSTINTTIAQIIANGTINDTASAYTRAVNVTMDTYVDALNDTMTAFVAWFTSMVIDNGTINQTIAMIMDNGTINETIAQIAGNGTFVPYTDDTGNKIWGSYNLTINITVFFIDAGTGRIGIGQITGFDPRPGLSVIGDIDVTHTATESDDHTMEMTVDAAGYGDVKGIVINYITGTVSVGENEEAILINIDESSSTGGDVIGLEILTTEGSAVIYGMKAGALVNPIVQLSGTFSNMDSALVKGVDNLNNFTSTALNETLFVADNDNVTIGDAAKFEEIEFLLETTASNPGIKPTFEYSTGVGTWGTFSPTDGTEGMRTTGVIAWDDSDIPSWAIGAGSEYLIRITRTQNNLVTVPIESKVQISSTTKYEWNKDGNLIINGIRASGNITPNANTTGSIGNVTDYFGEGFYNTLYAVTGYFGTLIARTLDSAFSYLNITDVPSAWGRGNDTSEISSMINTTTLWVDYANMSGQATISRGNTTAEILATVNLSSINGTYFYDIDFGNLTNVPKLGNTTTEIQIAINLSSINGTYFYDISFLNLTDVPQIGNTTTEILTAVNLSSLNGTYFYDVSFLNLTDVPQIGNTSLEIWIVIDNGTYYKLADGMSYTNITDEPWLENTTGWANYANQSGEATISRGNTTEEIHAAMNSTTFATGYNISTTDTVIANLTTGDQIGDIYSNGTCIVIRKRSTGKGLAIC